MNDKRYRFHGVCTKWKKDEEEKNEVAESLFKVVQGAQDQAKSRKVLSDANIKHREVEKESLRFFGNCKIDGSAWKRDFTIRKASPMEIN